MRISTILSLFLKCTLAAIELLTALADFFDCFLRQRGICNSDLSYRRRQKRPNLFKNDICMSASIHTEKRYASVLLKHFLQAMNQVFLRLVTHLVCHHNFKFPDFCRIFFGIGANEFFVGLFTNCIILVKYKSFKHREKTHKYENQLRYGILF